MIIQVHTDNHIQGSQELTNHVVAVVEASLERFKDRLTRVEVQFSDQSSAAKSSDTDKRCKLEARPNGLQPVVVSFDSNSVDHALHGAVERLERLLDHTFGRLNDAR
jgi:ribosome-associated translation inhibitor RaiA